MSKPNSNTGPRPLVVTIKASEWARGLPDCKHASLINSDGTKCCLGFDGLACGVAAEKLAVKCYPSDFLRPDDEQSKAYREAWSGSPLDDRFIGDLGRQAATINDTRDITDDERIAALRPVFRAATPPRIIRWLPNR